MKKMPFLLPKEALAGLMQGNKKAGGPARKRIVLENWNWVENVLFEKTGTS